MRYIVDDIGTVVAAMQDEDGKPFYDYGHTLSIAKRLTAKDKSLNQKGEKYPIIALKMDIAETVGDLVSYNLNLVIATYTKDDYTEKQRYDNVIKPILAPLYDKFFVSLRNSGLFAWPNYQGIPPHTRYDRPFWGTPAPMRNTALIFNDKLDAIEIVDLKINSKQNNC